MVTAQIEASSYIEIVRQPLNARQCALVVIDIQEKLLPPIYEKERLVRNSQLLIRLANILSLPVIATTQYAKGLGQIVPEIASLLIHRYRDERLPKGPRSASESLDADTVSGSVSSETTHYQPLDKLEFGCFGNGEFCSRVARLSGRNTLLLCGMETHICVLQTALGALNQGHIVHVAADAVSSRTELNWKLGLERMRDAGAVISSTEMMIYELLGKSGSPEFKEMLKHLK